jgi:DNA-binding GntR family transcriptional regulator
VLAVGSPRTLAEQACTTLHEAIVTGSVSPGDRLLVDDVARRFDMSRTPVREAFRLLDAHGLVRYVPHRGAVVAELSLEELRDLYRARLALEPLAIAASARRFGDEERQLAEVALARHLAARDRGSDRELWVSHAEFHFALYRPAGSRWLLRLIEPLWECSERYRFACASSPAELARGARELEALLDACGRGAAAEAARALRDHLTRSANAMARSMGSEALFDD